MELDMVKYILSFCTLLHILSSFHLMVKGYQAQKGLSAGQSLEIKGLLGLKKGLFGDE